MSDDKSDIGEMVHKHAPSMLRFMAVASALLPMARGATQAEDLDNYKGEPPTNEELALIERAIVESARVRTMSNNMASVLLETTEAGSVLAESDGGVYTVLPDKRTLDDEGSTKVLAMMPTIMAIDYDNFAQLAYAYMTTLETARRAEDNYKAVIPDSENATLFDIISGVMEAVMEREFITALGNITDLLGPSAPGDLHA